MERYVGNLTQRVKMELFSSTVDKQQSVTNLVRIVSDPQKLYLDSSEITDLSKERGNITRRSFIKLQTLRTRKLLQLREKAQWIEESRTY